MTGISDKIQKLESKFSGDIFTDESTRIMYSTDASAYREIPVAVVYPKTKQDIKLLISFASQNNTSIIPRTAGTSLAGQVVGGGIIADVSRYMTKILEINTKERWVLVQPGVVLEELNRYLEEFGLFFGPETSTANRCMIGGMVGNNACGTHSLIYGSTRDHTLELETVLSDGSEVTFKSTDVSDINRKVSHNTLEGRVYKNILDTLNNEDNKQSILREYPDIKLRRRNTGYALDLLLNMKPFNENGNRFNFVKLLAGSEGTLAFSTAIKLNLVSLPPANKALVCVHLKSVSNALKANLIALKHKPVAVELMDNIILELTKKNIAQEKNRFFVEGDPGAILIVEFAEEDPNEIVRKAQSMEEEMRSKGYGYHFPLIQNGDIKKVWDLRKAGLGILNNMAGDDKPVPVIEDTAVNPEQLPSYIAEFDEILKKYDKTCVYYAHISTGELHLRPILNLKDPKDVEIFHTLAEESARLVKKFNGSLSGEHGDGRLRGEFIPLMVGDKIYGLFQELKKVWDPKNIFNPGKIVNTPKMNTHLRYDPKIQARKIDTYFDFSEDQGILRAAEKCNGTAACRKTAVIGGTMCPSYMATHKESQSTRARANILREFLTISKKENPFDHKEIYDVMDLCLSCKACKSECPSSVDVTKLKAEFLQHYYKSHGIPFRTLLIANFSKLNKVGSYVPFIYNFFTQNSITSYLTSFITGFSSKRKLPKLNNITLDSWLKRNSKVMGSNFPNGSVYLFNDEFTKYNDTAIGIKAITLLSKLGYKVIIPNHYESARTYLSKGLVLKAKNIANQNIAMLSNIVSKDKPLVGIEPSAILALRDEYIDLADDDKREKAKVLAENSYMLEEFLMQEMELGHISKDQFTNSQRKIKLHGHCHQKALASTSPTKFVLNFPSNYTAEEIPSGCCGMAGSFGFEKEHYNLSMEIGEMVLFPAVRKTDENTLIVASGTSCRHQIKDGTGRRSYHPVEVLHDALRNS
ncbi:MAG: FAD-linked oxidase C-terminal domain-containing protein [Bacteroidales bacterium]|nr:FAD-linked oxidase C-terminal domain-containing protein [Bacteroidales bacterium]